MCQFCQADRAFVPKLFTLPLEWLDQTFISAQGGGESTLRWQTLQWLPTTFQVL